MAAVRERSCVRHVGQKAFFNCKNIKMHRVTPYVNAYELDADGNGPFALLDEKTNDIIGSNIKILDYSCYVESYQGSHPELISIILNPQKTFGVEMNPVHSAEIDPDSNIIICNDVLSYKNRTAEQEYPSEQP